jgi:Zn-dependent membrane protease YugP
MYIFWVMLGAAYLLSLFVQNKLRATHQKWGSIRNSANISGAETARAILDANGLCSVEVQAVQGRLSDHYDPRDRSIRLSEDVYAMHSVAAMVVAAHETGHAIQHEVGYKALAIRTAAAPMANASARFGIPTAIAGVFLGIPLITQIGVVGYVAALAFQFLTLPVEFDASKRALGQLDRLHLLSDAERQGARSVLRAAAMTYVAGAASAAVYILYLAMVVGRWIFKGPPPVPPPRLP